MYAWHHVNHQGVVKVMLVYYVGIEVLMPFVLLATQFRESLIQHCSYMYVFWVTLLILKPM